MRLFTAAHEALFASSSFGDFHACCRAVLDQGPIRCFRRRGVHLGSWALRAGTLHPGTKHACMPDEKAKTRNKGALQRVDEKSRIVQDSDLGSGGRWFGNRGVPCHTGVGVWAGPLSQAAG